MEPSRIVDAHQHVFWHGRDDDGLIAELDNHGIDYAWLLSWETAPFEDHPAYHPVLNPSNIRPDGTHAGIVLADLVKARDPFPSRFVLGYCPHPMQPMAPELLRAAVAMYGVRICGEWKFRLSIDDPRCLELFRIENYGNLFADLSAGSGRFALERDLEHAVKSLTLFQDRLLFGRDYYGQELPVSLEACRLPMRWSKKFTGATRRSSWLLQKKGAPEPSLPRFKL